MSATVPALAAGSDRLRHAWPLERTFVGALRLLDGLRGRLLRATRPASGYFAARRASRVALLGTSLVSLSLLGTAVAPLWMLALGPIVLGVPHLLADLRYCVVRPGWHRRPALWVGVGLPLLAVALGAGSAVGFAAVAGACAATSGGRGRRWIGIGLAALAALGCAAGGYRSTLLLVHLHNVVAVVLWWRWREPTSGQKNPRRWPLWLFIGVSVIIALGGLDHGLGPLARRGLGGLELTDHLATLAPGLDGTLGLRVVLLFTFAQSVHYVIWLRLVPEEDRERPTPRSFVASGRTLAREMGPWLLILTALAALAVASWAVFDLVHARSQYLRFARFHVFLELSVLAGLWTGGRRFVIAQPIKDP